jgi:hypothetical protein
METLMTLISEMLALASVAEFQLLARLGTPAMLVALLGLAIAACVADCRYRPNVAPPPTRSEADL